MCEYCKGTNEERKTLKDDDFDDINLKIYRYTFLNKTVLADGYSGEDSIPINFCPMCGDKLGIDNES